jgi:hypothetical protein
MGVSWENFVMNATIPRMRAALRLLGPGHITPMGARILERILDEEERKMRNERIQVATHIEDLDLHSLPVGTRIVTAHGKVFELDEVEGDRHDAGTRYWIEPGTLQPFHVVLKHWLPAHLLPAQEPPADDHA